MSRHEATFYTQTQTQFSFAMRLTRMLLHVCVQHDGRAAATGRCGGNSMSGDRRNSAPSASLSIVATRRVRISPPLCSTVAGAAATGRRGTGATARSRPSSPARTTTTAASPTAVSFRSYLPELQRCCPLSRLPPRRGLRRSNAACIQPLQTGSFSRPAADCLIGWTCDAQF